MLAGDLTSASVFFGVGYGTGGQVGLGTSASVPGRWFFALVDRRGRGRTWAAASVPVSGVGSVDVNTPASDGSAINFQKLDLNGDGQYGGAGDTLTAGAVTFSDTGAAASATFTNPSAGVAGLVSGQATSATVSAQTVTNVEIDGDGTVNTAAGDLASGQLLTLALTSPTLTVGTSSDGFDVSASTATISALLPQAPAAPATDTRYWIGAEVSGLSGSLLGRRCCERADLLRLYDPQRGRLASTRQGQDQRSPRRRSTGRRRSAAPPRPRSRPSPGRRRTSPAT